MATQVEQAEAAEVISELLHADVVGGAGGPGTTSRVQVVAPFQVCHAGIVYRPNEVADVPQHVAAHWVANGWVVEQ
jgi:hypothetical protein